MRVCDYLANKLYETGVEYVYGLVGGGTAGLNDGFFSHPKIKFIPFHHEQGAGHAAVGSARTNNKLSVVNVTTGCGGTNVITSLLNAWQESMPVLFLSGNTKFENMATYINKEKNISLRRYGVQEHDIVTTVKNLTKKAVICNDLKDVPFLIDQAIDICTSGRPGPVWLDFPSNIQSAEIPKLYSIYKKPLPYIHELIVEEKYFSKLNILLKSSKRPLVVAGGGIRMSGCVSNFNSFIKKYKLPFVTTFLSRDVSNSDNNYNIGMLGIKGNRAANFAMQNADLLLILGSSMNVTHIGYDAKTFSPHSKKVMVDIDKSELKKDNFKIDLSINMNLQYFFEYEMVSLKYTDWLSKVNHWKQLWPTYIEESHRSDKGGLNLYEIVEGINRHSTDNDAVIVDAGQPCYICSSNLKIKNKQRYMAQSAQGDMGYAIPASVGIHYANPSLNIILVIGEGSFFTNVQELAVIRKLNIPVKIFVINNDGYMSIKQTQDKFFNGRRNAVSESTGVHFPDIEKIAQAFEIPYSKISDNVQLDENMEEIMQLYSTPHIIEFISQNTLDVFPAQAFKPNGKQGGLHEMAPFLSQDIINKEMVVKI